jgi:hypothetical protein
MHYIDWYGSSSFVEAICCSFVSIDASFTHFASMTKFITFRNLQPSLRLAGGLASHQSLSKQMTYCPPSL